MSEESHIRLKQAGVHADVVGDEAIVISFATGRYYTIRGMGAYVIDALTRSPIGLSETLAAAVVAYPATGKLRLMEDLTDLFGRLKAEQLTEPYVWNGPPASFRFAGDYFIEFEVKSELADILTLDPIHEVSDEGWPERRNKR